jgi:hypothetical protein
MKLPSKYKVESVNCTYYEQGDIYLQGKVFIYLYLTPFIPPPGQAYSRRGGIIRKWGDAPLKHPVAEGKGVTRGIIRRCAEGDLGENRYLNGAVEFDTHPEKTVI